MRRRVVSEYIDALVRSPKFRDHVAGRHLYPARRANWQDPPDFLHPSVLDVFVQMGIRRLYRHQAEALGHVCAGRHTVIATPTASGKSLIYNTAFVDAAARSNSAGALYLFPLKALARDQLEVLLKWFQAASPLELTAAVYDGDTTAYQRRKIRSHPPRAILTNPEMLHLALLPHHPGWSTFFSSLRMVVVDEVHTYRGITGAHMSQVLRRLLRICRYYGSAPTFVFTSATVANPGGLAAQLIGQQVETVEKNGAGSGRRHGVLIEPADSPANTAVLLLKAALARDLRTIVYTQSRRAAELVALWAGARTTKKADKISVYRAGLKPDERRRIERRLKQGELLAVVSTSALELGIDVGDLDLCILIGYPGSMVATWQRSGRVGRQGQESAMILIASQDALDHYFTANPEKLWQGRPEPAVVNPANSVVLQDHLVCGACELPLEADDP
ncbi:MAG: DEAD/DEAH box helicase, partial [Desulfosarcinaceae bacterium]